jgi:hypothetical protein
MKFSINHLLLAACISAFPVLRGHTEVTNTLSFALTLYRQGEIVTNNNVVTAQTETLRLSNKQVLGVLAVATSQNFPTGSSLAVVMTNPPNVFVVSKDKHVVADVSSFFSLSFDTNMVVKPKQTVTTAAETRTEYSLATLTFDDNAGNSFSLSGFATKQLRIAAVKNGEQKEADSILLECSGTGAAGGRFCVVKGKVKLSGGGQANAAP